MTIRVQRVDGARYALLLRRMQVAILPGDTPFDTAQGAWWVAFDGDLPAAFGGWTPSVRWSDAAYLCRAGVVVSHRGQGLQKRLIGARERHARAQGMAWAITDTRSNPASSNSLIACGYRLFEPAKPWSARGALYWRKKLLGAA